VSQRNVTAIIEHPAARQLHTIHPCQDRLDLIY